MPEISSVDAAVEKIVQEAPPVEKPTHEAPAEPTPVKGEEDGAASVKSPEEVAELSAFEQELIEEFKEEYEQVPEEHRKAFLGSLKRSYRKQAKQMTELGTLRKAVSALREAGVTNEDLVSLVNTKRGNGRAATSEPKTATEVTKRGFQRWLAEATDPAEKENLRAAEQVIREVVEDLVSSRIEEIRDKEVKPLRDRLDWQDRQTLTKRSQGLEQAINDLEDKLGYSGSLVETHRATMHALGLREPDLTAQELLVRAAGFETVMNARLKMASKGDSIALEEGKKPPASVVKKPGPTELPRKPSGVISITRAIDMLMSKPKR